MADGPQAKKRVDEDAGGPDALGAGGGGANHVTSGGGAGAGIPDADTAMRVGDAVTRGDADADRKRLFPETESRDVGSHPGQNTPGDVDAGE
jgi:hypothetical protein